MDNLAALVMDLALNKEGALGEIELLRQTPANRAALFAEPGLVACVLNLVSAGNNNIQAVQLLFNMAEEDSLRRTMFSSPGLVGTLVQPCGDESNNTLFAKQNVLLQLLSGPGHDSNRMDFIRDGYAQRLAGFKYGNDLNYGRCLVLRKCVEGDGSITDKLREEFFRAPGLMEKLVHPDASWYPLEIFQELTKCKRIAGELLTFPGFADFMVRTIEQGHSLVFSFDLLTQLVDNAPSQALLDCPRWWSALVRMQNHQRETDNLLRHLQVALCRNHHQHHHAEHIYHSEEGAMVALWGNVPAVWTAISVPRVKQRSPLRRLPIEMFRLVKDTLCGHGATWGASAE